MSDEVLAKMISDYMSFVGKHVSFGWQGGEPLLTGLNFFKKVVYYQQLYGRPGQIVANGFQTNAILIDDDWARLFKNYNFLVGVSLDGPANIHDYYRRNSAGQPSYDRVMKSIDTLKRHRVEFNILTLVNNRNVSQAKELYDFFVGHGMRYLQFIPCIEQDPITKQAADFSITPEQYGKFLCDLFDMWMGDGMPSTYIRLFDALLMDYAGVGQPLCQFQEKCGNYVVVEYNGDVYACDFFVEPEWFLGNLMETSLEQIIRSDKFAFFSERKSRHTQICQQCRWLSICHGGCPKHRTVLGNEIEYPSYFCPAYKTFFEYSHQRFIDLSRRVLEKQRNHSIKSKETSGSRKKVGRNDPCPCGSGKKYKRCCMGREM
jgi:uncharacterized protein